MKHIILIILVLISSLFIVKAQPTIPDATCLEVYYCDFFFKPSNDDVYRQAFIDVDIRLFCSNSDKIETTIDKSSFNIDLDSMFYKMQTETISVFSYNAHNKDSKFIVTFSFLKKAKKYDQYMVRIENLNVPLLYIFHLNPESL